MGYTVIALAAAAAGLLLGTGWLLAGASLLRRWGIEPHADGVLAGRRLGAAYLGIALMLYLARSAPRSEARDAIGAGMLCALSLLAMTGLSEFRSGRAGAGILASAALELALALGFAWVLLAG